MNSFELAPFFLFLLAVGFSYMIWLRAGKESGINKTIGQVIAGLIAVTALVLVLFAYVSHGKHFSGHGKNGGAHSGMMGKMGMCSDSKMMSKGSCDMMGKVDSKKMEECAKVATKDIKAVNK